MNCLSYNLGARILCEPEFCHPSFNNVKAAIKYANLTPCLLKSTLMSHVSHGPYGGGRNQETKREAAEAFWRGLSSTEWLDMLENIAFDRCTNLEDESLPASPQDLMHEKAITQRGIFVPCMKFICIPVLYLWCVCV